MGAVVLLAAGCDALSPDVVVGERVDPTDPTVERAPPTPAWDPVRALPAPVEGRAPPEYIAPDINLVVEAVHDLPRVWIPGRAHQIAIDVRNVGADAAPSNSIRLSLRTHTRWVDDLEVDTLIVDRLEGEEARSVVATVTLPDWTPSGSFAFEAHVDPDDLIPEHNEKDNVWFGQIVDVSEVLVEPARLDFGPTQIGCAARATLSVENQSLELVILTEVALEGGAAAEPFRLSGPRLPRTLSPAGEPGSRVELQVVFDPSGVVAPDTRLRVTTSEHRGLPLFVPLTGRAEVAPTHLDRHRQRFGPMVDYLLVIDRGAGMAAEREELRDYVVQWMDTLRGQQVDYQLGVTLADPAATDGAIIGPVVSSESMTPEADVRELLDSIEIDPEAPNEGLEAARRFVLHHGGWLRPEAGLVFVFLANRDDASPDDVSAYVGALRQTKRRPEQVTANAIILDGTSRCADERPALRYIDTAIAMGGRLDPICDVDAYEGLWALPHPTFGLRSEFALEHEPRGSTLTVRVDGALTAPIDGRGRDVWSYDRWSRIVEFEPLRAPSFGAVIDFEYVPLCED